MKPDKSTYLCFDKDDTQETAVQKYTRRYGTKPERVMWANSLWWVGPVPEPVSGTPPPDKVGR